MTMRQFVALQRQHERREQREDARFATLATLIYYSTERKEGAPELGPHDFFPSLPRPRAQRERRQRGNAMHAQFLALVGKRVKARDDTYS